MSGLMKIYDYRYVEPTPVENTDATAKLHVASVLPSFVTALVLVNGEVVDFKTSESAIVGGTLDITVPPMYQGKPYSIFVFSSKNGYANRDIGRSIWGVWFQNLKEESFVDFGISQRPKGSVLIVVPMKGTGFKINFTRLGDSAAGHGEVVTT